MLSRTESAAVIPEEGVRDLEAYLVGDKKPKYSLEIEQGIRYFKAQELGEEYARLRQRMQEIVDARKAVDQSVENLRTEVMILRGRYIS